MTASRFVEPVATAAPAMAPPRLGGLRAEFLRYFACSALGLASDVLVFQALLKLGLGWQLAAAAGFLLGLVLVYALSVRWVFTHRRVGDAGAEFALFAGVGLVGLMLTEAVLWLLLSRWQWPPLVAKLACAGVVFLCNFGLRKALLFTQPEVAR